MLEQQVQARMETPSRQARRYTPHGAAAELHQATEREVLIAGPAGTGKTRAWLELMHDRAQANGRYRALMVRKWKASLPETALVTYEEHVLGTEHPMITDGPRRNNRQAYRYPNGAHVVVGGMDKATKIMSSEYDDIFAPEATELNEEDWFALLSRLRNNSRPVQQIIGDVNPTTPLHWLYLRYQSGALRLINSTHKDNPRLWDGNDWTTQGRAYLDTLGSLTGSAKDRLLKGLWVQAEGLIYTTFGTHNISDDADYQPGNGEIVWGVDDGYTGSRDERTGLYTANSHPRVFLLAQVRKNGQVCVFAEHHAIHRESSKHLEEVLTLPYPNPSVIYLDSSAAELRGKMQALGLPAMKATHSVAEGIKVVRGMLAPDTNGFVHLLIHPRCRLLRHEMTAYAYKRGSEEPEKTNDNALDALRYLAWPHRRTL
jgi:phage terminase large subunit